MQSFNTDKFITWNLLPTLTTQTDIRPTETLIIFQTEGNTMFLRIERKTSISVRNPLMGYFLQKDRQISLQFS